MKWFITGPVVALLMLLGACTLNPSVPNVISLQNIAKLEASYGPFQSAAVGYVTVCPKSSACYIKGAAKQLSDANDAVMTAFGNLEDYAKAHQGETDLKLKALYDAAVTAVSSVKSIEKIYGVQPNG